MIMYPIEENILKIHQYCARMRFLSQTNVTGGCLLAIHKNIEKITLVLAGARKDSGGQRMALGGTMGGLMTTISPGRPMTGLGSSGMVGTTVGTAGMTLQSSHGTLQKDHKSLLEMYLDPMIFFENPFTSYDFLFFPTSQATEAVWEEPQAEAPPEEVEAREFAAQDGEQAEEGEFTKMLAELDDQQQAVPEEAAGSSMDSKANVVEAEDFEALVDHWFPDPMVTSQSVFFERIVHIMCSLHGLMYNSLDRLLFCGGGFFMSHLALLTLWSPPVKIFPRYKFHNGSLI